MTSGVARSTLLLTRKYDTSAEIVSTPSVMPVLVTTSSIVMAREVGPVWYGSAGAYCG